MTTRSKALGGGGEGGRERAWWFDEVLLTDRSAAFRGTECGAVTQRTAAEAILGVKNTLDRHWWEPVRRAVLRFAGIDGTILSIGDRQEERKDEGLRPDRVVVSYIDRQGSRRHLIQEHHEGLVAALEEVCARRGWELNVVQAEKLTKEEQLEVAARTTVRFVFCYVLQQGGSESDEGCSDSSCWVFTGMVSVSFYFYFSLTSACC